MRILSVGEIIIDVYPEGREIGGAALNFAAHAARCGAESMLLSAVGHDEDGDAALAALSRFGVRCEMISRVPHPTGRCMETLDAAGVPTHRVLPDAAYDYLTLSEREVCNLAEWGADALYFGTLIQRAGSRRPVRQLAEELSFREIFCDVNLRDGCYDADSVLYCLQKATILKLSAEEEPQLRAFGYYAPAGETDAGVARGLAAAFPNLKILLLTKGKDGAFALDCVSGQEYRQAALGSRVVSTTGAGDSFSAAFLTAYLEGSPIALCLRNAAKVSGEVVAHREAVPMD